MFFLFIRAVVRHPLRSLSALFWWLLGKKLRARNRFGILVDDEQRRYEKWLAAKAGLDDDARRTVAERVAHLSGNTNILILCRLSAENKPAQVAATVASLKAQLYPNWTLLFVGDGAETYLDADEHRLHAAPGGAKGQEACLKAMRKAAYVGWMRPGDSLDEEALCAFMATLGDDRPALIYSDEDQINARGVRRFAHFKPGWNFELLLACDYVGGLSLMRADLLKGEAVSDDVASWQGRYHALIQVGAPLKSEQVRHVSDVLYQRYVPRFLRADAVRPSSSGVAHEAVLQAYCQREGLQADIERDTFGHVRLRRDVAEPKPLVSLIVPTRDMLRLTRKCVRSILEKTTYENFELLIVDNDSEKTATLAFFDKVVRQPKVRVIKYPGVFNYSAINNFAVGHARGDYIGLINNDTEVITPEWLDELMAQAVRPEAGAVGAKLLYADGRIQHAGVYTGMGRLAGHGHRFLKNDAPGYFYRAHLSQFVSAVTGACLIVEKEKFQAVGGLDADELCVAFNDVDLCLKLQDAGYHNIYVPHAVLYHYESKSRGKDLKGEKRARYLREAAVLQQRWGTHLAPDRYFNRNLSTQREDFTLS
nr:glycosyltransferase family 2 protein [Kordiimonas marina]